MFITSSDRTAFVWNGEAISYRTVMDRIAGHAEMLQLAEGARVAIYAPNSPAWAYAFYAAWRAGCVAVPIDYMSPADEVAYILDDCTPDVMFHAGDTEAAAREAVDLAAKPVRLINLDTAGIPGDAEMDPAADTSLSIPESAVHDTAVIIYTSGTTGSPKGVMLSYDNLLANMEAVCRDIEIFTQDRTVMALLPFHHIFPLLGSLVAPLSVHATVAFVPSLASEDIMATLQNNRVAIIIGVPRLYMAIRKGIMDKINANTVARILFKLARTVNSRALSKKIFKKVHERFGGNIDYLVCGGAKMDPDAMRDYKTLGFEMLEGFGMTEAAPMITFTRPGKWIIGSAGQAMPCLEVAVKDGEIAAKGRNIMKGYFGRPEETAEVLRDGWLYTGDLGYIDENGYLFITGRRKEIIVLASGKNINPEEVEKRLLATSDMIAEAGVFYADDMLQAAILPDFKRLRDKAVLNLEELFRWDIIDAYNRTAAHHKKITRFVLLKQELPKTRLGKIQRFKLQEMVRELTAPRSADVDEPEFEEYQVIRNFLREQTRTDIHPEDHIEIDLGLDSLDKVSLLTFLQSTFGITVKEDIFLQHPTVEKLSAFMKEKQRQITVEAVKWAEIFREKVDLTLPRSWFTQNLLKNIFKVSLSTYFRVRGEGTENLPEGPFILAPNHQSYIDGLFVSIFLKNRVIKNTYFYAKAKHVKRWWLRALASRNNVIVMDVNRDLKQSLQKLAEVLKRGKNIIIFPEGTRTRTGRLGQFKKSFAILSRELNVPVVPVSINGAFDALPRGSRIPRPWKKISVKFHAPVFPENLSYEEIMDRVRGELESELAAS